MELLLIVLVLLFLFGGGGYYGAENVVVSLAESLESKNCRNVIGVFHSERQRNEELVRQAEQMREDGELELQDEMW